MGVLEYKDLATGSIKDVDEKNKVVTGYLSRFENKDLDGDIVVKGAFKRSLDHRRKSILFLNQHRWHEPHGFFDVLQEDQKGLYFESRPLIDTTFSSNAIKLYAAGIIKEHSIGFKTVLSEKDYKQDARIIKEVKLYEGSNVTMGANPETPFMGFKSFCPEQADKQIKKMLKLLRHGDLTDEGFMQLEIAILQLQKSSVEYGRTKALEGRDTPPGTRETDDTLIKVFDEFI